MLPTIAATLSLSYPNKTGQLSNLLPLDLRKGISICAGAAIDRLLVWIV
jgi:hypothetical protein